MKAKYGDAVRDMNSLERYEELMKLLEEIAEEDDNIHHLDIVHPDLAACIKEKKFLAITRIYWTLERISRYYSMMMKSKCWRILTREQGNRMSSNWSRWMY